MTRKKPDTDHSRELRLRAEKELPAARRGTAAAATDPARLLHELQVHEIELELQNEELQRTRKDLEESLARYTSLYESAPVGFLTLDRDGIIRRVNLTGARLLGLERARLIGRRFGLLLAAQSRPVFHAFLAKVWGSQSKEACEVVLQAEGATPFTLGLGGTATEDGQECLIVAADISDRKLADEKIGSQLDELQRWQGVMLGREDRVQELKREVNELCRRAGRPARYPSQEGEPATPAPREPSQEGR
jgi:PAS domain S-box-containing protein